MFCEFVWPRVVQRGVSVDDSNWNLNKKSKVMQYISHKK